MVRNERLPFARHMISLVTMLMKQEPVHPLRRCYLITAGILLAGLGSALAIYLTAEEIPDNPFADYENSKRFSHEVQRMGGKMALVANDMTSWFVGLWQGRSLAWTVATLSIAIAVLYYVIASGIQSEVPPAGLPDHDAGA